MCYLMDNIECVKTIKIKKHSASKGASGDNIGFAPPFSPPSRLPSLPLQGIPLLIAAATLAGALLDAALLATATLARDTSHQDTSPQDKSPQLSRQDTSPQSRHVGTRYVGTRHVGARSWHVTSVHVTSAVDSTVASLKFGQSGNSWRVVAAGGRKRNKLFSSGFLLFELNFGEKKIFYRNVLYVMICSLVNLKLKSLLFLY